MNDRRAENFQRHLYQLGYSQGSCKGLTRCVREFLNYHQSKGEFIPEDIRKFYEWLHERPNKVTCGALSELMIYQFMYALKIFFNYLEHTAQIEVNPMSSMKYKQPKGKVRQPLTQEETKQLFEASESWKEKAILHMFYSCGLRKSEGTALNINDVNLKQQLLYVRSGKGLKRRVVPLTEKVAKDFEQYYLKARTTLTKSHDENAWMINYRGKRMSGNSLNAVVKILIKRAGLNPEISLHYLRHSIATHLLENGLKVESVRDFLGHKHLETTQIYVKVQQELLRELNQKSL